MSNPSFESPVVSAFTYGCPPSWSCSGGVVVIPSGSLPWGGATTFDGGQYVGFQVTGTYVKQTLSGLVAGTNYKLTFYAGMRGGPSDYVPVQVLINSVVVYTVTQPPTNAFTKYTYIFQATATSVILGFQNGYANPSLDTTCFVDYVQIASSPTSAPTSAPTGTMYPTIYISPSTTTRLLHQFTFEDTFPNGVVPAYAKVKDSVGNSTATLYNGVTISNGRAVFKYMGPSFPVPYIKLPVNSLNSMAVFTIELWVNVDVTNNPSSTLFSFGNRVYPNLASLTTGISGLSMYLAVVFNTVAQQAKLYQNGVLVSSQSITWTAFSDSFSYIGRNYTGTGQGFVGSMDEFRIWYGELSASVIKDHYQVGVDPSHISLSVSDTTSNVNITFMANSLQSVNIGLYGGNALNRMFGPETKFTVTPVDSQCAFSKTLSLSAVTSSVAKALPAMNYQVTLLNSNLPAPLITSCDPNNPTSSCYCTPSKTPYQYLSDSGQLSQSLAITQVTMQTTQVNFVYRSGICFELLLKTKTDSFSNVTGDMSADPAASCYAPTTTVLAKGDSYPLSVVVFEMYPAPGSPPVWYRATTTYAGTTYSAVATSNTMLDFNMQDSVVSIYDLVSGPATQSFTYAPNFVTNPGGYTQVASGILYTVRPSSIYLTPPFDYPFQVTVQRNGLDGSAIVVQGWYIPVKGTSSSVTPNVFPVASDPTLIYMVLRDPPGGASYTTFHSGTTVDFALAVDGLQTSNNEDVGALAHEAGLSNGLTTFAGIGVGVIDDVFAIQGGMDFNDQTSRTVSFSQASNQHYDVSLSFSFDISTSTDPNLAGHASDIIIGGGVVLIVSSATKGMDIN